MQDIREVVTALEAAGVKFAVADGELLVQFEPRGDPETLRAIRALDDETVRAMTGRMSEIREYVELRSDFHALYFDAALRQVEGHGAPGDFLPWLRDNAGGLYQRLTASIPDELSRLWAARVSRGTFCAVLDEFVKVHAEAVAFYRFCKEGKKWKS